MENEEQDSPTYSTLKKEPVNIPEKPTTIGTPAHPLPKFLPKKLAALILVLIVLIFVGTAAAHYFIKNSNNNSAPAPSPVVSKAPSQVDLAQSNGNIIKFLNNGDIYFENKKGGYSFTFPSKLGETKYQIVEQSKGHTLVARDESAIRPEAFEVVSLLLMPEYSLINYEDIKNMEIGSIQKDSAGLKYQRGNDLIIDGYKGIVISYLQGFDESRDIIEHKSSLNEKQLIYINKNGLLYLIMPLDSTNLDSQSISGKIIKTFKFTQ